MPILPAVPTAPKPTLEELDAAADNLLAFPVTPTLTPTVSEVIGAYLSAILDYVDPSEFYPALYL